MVILLIPTHFCQEGFEDREMERQAPWKFRTLVSHIIFCFSQIRRSKFK